tara:strand:+ start:405 stop:770 length:366 start_codon:yes stop_codon:yes gene_type:complete
MIFLEPIKKYAVFTGRATKKEYWLFLLFATIVQIILLMIDVVIGIYDSEIGFGALSGIFTLGIILPSIAVAVRRLHDTNRSGWMMLILLIPLVGIWVLVLLCFASDKGTNRFGKNPQGILE